MSSSDEQLTCLLNQGLEVLGQSAPTEALLCYLNLLSKWNRAYNLTAVRAKEDMVTRHLLDSFAILPWVKGQYLLDVGTGAGLPGIPLAIARPELQVVLLDSNGKKIRFLQEVKRVLSLTNVDIVKARVEDYRAESSFDTVISRAFSDIEQMMAWTKHVIAPDGIWLAMKGPQVDKELLKITQPFQVKTYHVPGILGMRCCVIVENKE